MAYKKLRQAEEKPTELTGDLITQIISRVPAKDLVRFAFVSKSWSSLIYTDPHLCRTASSERPYFVVSRKPHNYWFDLDSIDDENAKLEEIHNPWINEDDKAQLVGSCHGLLVLQQRNSHKIVVLNPTTKEHHSVPPNPAGDENVYVVGFGYDQVHGCYKLVTRARPTSRDDRAVELMIYDVRRGTWRDFKFDDLDIDHLAGETYVDGAFYWCVDSGITRDTEFMRIIRFDLAEEKFGEVEPPKFGEIMHNLEMTVFDCRLCLVCEDDSKPNCDRSMEFWLMEAECDETRSYPRRWTNFLSICDPASLLSYPFTVPALIPVCFSACENKVLFNVDGLQLFWYDLGKNEFIPLKNPANTHFSMVWVTCCVRSLVGI